MVARTESANPMQATAIIAAGGRGRRLGAGAPKQLLELGGRPMLTWSVDAFLTCAARRKKLLVVKQEQARATRNQ